MSQYLALCSLEQVLAEKLGTYLQARGRHLPRRQTVSQAKLPRRLQHPH